MDKSWIIRKVLLDNLKETKTRKGDTVPIQILKNWLIQNSFTYEESTPVIYSLFKEGFFLQEMQDGQLAYKMLKDWWEL